MVYYNDINRGLSDHDTVCVVSCHVRNSDYKANGIRPERKMLTG